MRDTMAKIDDIAGTIERLDCGHPESAHSSITRGYAILHGIKVCYDCAQSQEIADLKTAQRYTAYLTADGPYRHSLTGWVGWKLATVTRLWETSAGGFCRGRNIMRFRATDVHGQKWYGTSPGVGMYARMHKAKSRP